MGRGEGASGFAADRLRRQRKLQDPRNHHVSQGSKKEIPKVFRFGKQLRLARFEISLVILIKS